MPTKIIPDEKFLPTKNFTVSKIFRNLFRAFIFTQVVQKYRPSSVRLNIWSTVNTYAESKIPVESWAHRFFLFHTYCETQITKVVITNVIFPNVNRINQWYEKKALRNGITWDPLLFPITLQKKIYYQWMTWATMKQQKII